MTGGGSEKRSPIFRIHFERRTNMTLSWVGCREYEMRRKDNRKSKHFSLTNLKIEMGKASGKTGFRRDDQKLSFRHVKL